MWVRSLKMAAVLLIFASSQALAIVYEENFNDPLEDWVSGWLYTGSNLQNYYVAFGTCDDNNRGNQPDGLWVSDDKACGSLNSASPVTINFDPVLGDTAAYFSLDVYACSGDVTLNIYDRSGVLDQSVLLPSSCFEFLNTYEFNLINGISAFEFESVSSAIEGNTAIDNVILDTEGRILAEGPAPVPGLQSWASILLVMILMGAGLVLLRRRVV